MSAPNRAQASDAPPRLEVAGVRKAYGSIEALKGVDVVIAPGEIHALCGHNGAGKSTLVKILSGLVHPDGGEIRLGGEAVELRNAQDAQRHGIAVVDQEISLIEILPIADNLLLGLHDAPFFHKRRAGGGAIRTLLARVGLEGLDPSLPVGRLSMGERQLVEIARALGRADRLLILDEPTATLSDAETARVFAALRPLAASGTSIVFVSHRLGDVLELCDRVSVLRDGAKVGTAAVDEELDRQALVNLMVGEVVESVDHDRAAAIGGQVLLEASGFSIPGRLREADLVVRRGEIVGLAGQLGSGASEWLRGLAGLMPSAFGEVRIGGRSVRLTSPLRSLGAGIHYLSADRKSEGLFLESSIAQNLIATRLRGLTRLGIVSRARAREASGQLASMIGLESRREQPVRTLSGGNQQKVFLGRCLERAESGLLLLDEPTRGVDVAGRTEIHEMIRAAARAGNAVVFASTEFDEVLDLSDTVVALCAGRVISARPRHQVRVPRLVAEMTQAMAGAKPA